MAPTASPTASSSRLPPPSRASASTSATLGPTALQHTLCRIFADERTSSTSSFTSRDKTNSPSMFTVLNNDTELIRDAQVLFAQLAPDASTAAPSTTSTASFNVLRSTPLASPFTSSFDRPMPPRRTRERDLEALEHERLSALAAVVATAILRDLEHDKQRNNTTDDASHSNKRKRHERSDAPPTTTATWDLVTLLCAANVSFSAFLRHFSSLLDQQLLLLNPDVVAVTTHLKEEFTVASVLFAKFRAIWQRHVPSAASFGTVRSSTIAGMLEIEQEPPIDAVPTRKMSDLLLEKQLGTVDRLEQLRDAGWLLFLIAKRRAGAKYTGLQPLYYLLLAALHLVVTAVEAPSVEVEVAAALNALGASGDRASAPSSSSDNNNKLLEALCANPKVDLRDVQAAANHLHNVLRALCTEKVLQTPTGDVETTAGVLHASVLASNVTHLHDFYQQTFVIDCRSLDERLYLDARTYDVIMGPRPVLSTAATTRSTTALSSPVLRPVRTAERPVASPSRFASPARVTPPRLGRMGASGVLHRPIAMTFSGSSGIVTTSTSSNNHPPASPFTRQAWQSPAATGSLLLRGTTTLAASAAAAHTPNTRAFLHTAATHHVSPFGAQTPVTAAVETSNWLRDTLSCTSDRNALSPQLERFFRDCATDPTAHIARVLDDRTQRLLTYRTRRSTVTPSPSFENDVTTYSEVDSSVDRAKHLGVALFYRVLEALLVSERERLRTTNFASLLHNDVFLASLFACALEVVLKAQGLITLAFPVVLEIVNVNAFDFGKIVESFVKHAPSLPHVLKRHMRDLEQTILDSMAWRSDSGLYVVLAGDNVVGAAAGLLTQASASSAALTSDALLAAVTNGTSTSTPAAAASTAASATTRTSVLQLFFRKVLSLAASRIFRLGTILELDAKYLNQVWTAIKECISAHHALLRDRHLDHVILCSLYGVCKVNHVQPEVTFKRVLDAYKKLQSHQHATAIGTAHGGMTPLGMLHHRSSSHSNDVIRSIKLDDATNARGDIIKFYNKCYVPTMKVFMLQFQGQDKQMAAADAVVASVAPSTATTTLHAPPGFTPRRDSRSIGNSSSSVAASASDTEIVAEAAVDAAEKAMRSYGHAPGPATPHRTGGRGHCVPSASGCGIVLHATGTGHTSASPLLTTTPSLPLFTTAEVQSLPLSVHQTSPKRVLATNVYMSPLQQARLQQHQQQSNRHTPRLHALYAFGESPARDLALINRAVNTNVLRSRVAVRPPLVLRANQLDDDDEEDDDDEQEEEEEENDENEANDDAMETSASNSAASTPTNALKRRRQV